VLLALARVRNLRGNSESALAVALEAKRIAPSDPKILYAVGVLCLQMDLIKDATSNLERAAALDRNPATLYALASARVANRDLDSAVKIYADLLKSDPDNAQVNYALGATYFLESQNEAAKPYFERSLALQPDQVESFYYLGLVADQSGDKEKSIQILRTVTDRSPDHVRAHIALGMEYRSVGRLRESRIELEAAVRLSPDSQKAHYQLGLVLNALKEQDNAKPEIASFESLIRSGRYAEAQTALESYTAAHPTSWRSQYQLGYVYFRLHMTQLSVKLLCKSLLLNGNFAESHKILAYDLNILGRQDLAMRELDRALKANPSSAESHYEIGRIYYERGSYLDAVQHLERAKSLDPNAVRTYHNLGLAYAAVMENSKAIQNFEEGLRRNAQMSKPSAWPLIDFATYYNLQGDFNKARALLLQSITIEATCDQAFEELSKAYRGLGQTGDAIEALRRAIALNPQKAEFHYVLARLYTQTHQPDEAKAQLAEYQQSRQMNSHSN
jgi:tetratricopeptide (TPR) repeat protein